MNTKNDSKIGDCFQTALTKKNGNRKKRDLQIVHAPNLKGNLTSKNKENAEVNYAKTKNALRTITGFQELRSTLRCRTRIW